jgi:hypothetical protein
MAYLFLARACSDELDSPAGTFDGNGCCDGDRSCNLELSQ